MSSEQMRTIYKVLKGAFEIALFVWFVNSFPRESSVISCSEVRVIVGNHTAVIGTQLA